VSNPSLLIAKRNLSNFDENSVISFLIEMFRRLNALSTPLYTPNVAQANFSVETTPANHKTQSFVAFEENSVISFLVEMFLRLNALSTPYYTPNLVQDNFSVGTTPANRKTQSFVAFDVICVISFLIEIFRRLNAHYTPFYLAECSARQFQRQDNPYILQNAIFRCFRRKLCYFAPG
jgi:hypothetical protein